MDRELIDYLPPILRGNKDFILLLKAQQGEVEKLIVGVNQLLNNQFITTTDNYGIGRYEKMLNINSKGTDDLTIRQFRVLAKYNEYIPYTYFRLLEMLDNLCGSDNLFIQLKDLTLSIRIKLEIKDRFKDIKGLLHRVLPANIAIDLSVLYNIWKIPKDRKIKWTNVTLRTWKEMKDEVL